jgi:hypothetical protein
LFVLYSRILIFKKRLDTFFLRALIGLSFGLRIRIS